MNYNKRQAFRTTSIDRKRKYASVFECNVCEGALDFILPADWIDCKKKRIPYIIRADYVPDMILPNGIVIEVKGWFPLPDRRKMEGVIKSNEGIDLRMVFSDPWTKQGQLVSPGTWCDKRGITWAAHAIPREWLNEPDVRWRP